MLPSLVFNLDRHCLQYYPYTRVRGSRGLIRHKMAALHLNDPSQDNVLYCISFLTAYFRILL